MNGWYIAAGLLAICIIWVSGYCTGAILASGSLYDQRLRELYGVEDDHIKNEADNE